MAEQPYEYEVSFIRTVTIADGAELRQEVADNCNMLAGQGFRLVKTKQIRGEDETCGILLIFERPYVP